MTKHNISNFENGKKIFIGNFILNLFSYFLICFWLDEFVDENSIELPSFRRCGCNFFYL